MDPIVGNRREGPRPRRSTLAELGAATGAAQAVLLTLFLTSVAREEGALLEGSAQLRVVLDQGTRDAVTKGAEVLHGKRAEGALFHPTVVDRIPYTCELVHEETFGPVIPIIRVPDDIAEVIRISNSTAYGLSSGICTNRYDYIQRFVAELEVGTVNLWEVPGYRIEMSPFGGIKDSGLGYKEGVVEAMKSFTSPEAAERPVLLEVFTDKDEDTRMLKNYYHQLK